MATSDVTLRELYDRLEAEFYAFVSATQTQIGEINTIIVESGDPGTLFYSHSQSSPAYTWTISHARGLSPSSVMTKDASGREVFGRVEFPDTNTALVRFGRPLAGSAELIFKPA